MANLTDYITYKPSAIAVSQADFDDLWRLWDKIEYTPNPLNKKYMIKRKQATFGGQYNFAGQVSNQFPLESNEWPTIVKEVLQVTRVMSGSESYNVVHVNWYPDGSAGLEPHSDDLRKNVPGMDIYSYTLLSQPGNPRGFQVYKKSAEKGTGELIKEYSLDHGDLVVMTTEMQEKFKHGVKKSSAKRFKDLKRINMTVRAWV